MPIESYEIESYEVGVGAGTIGDFSFSTNQKLLLTPVRLYHGIQPPIHILFPENPSGVGLVLKRSEFDATLLITLHEKFFAGIYAILRSEKPVLFTYEAEHYYSDPAAPSRFRVTAARVTTETEPVGEGIDASVMED